MAATDAPLTSSTASEAARTLTTVTAGFDRLSRPCRAMVAIFFDLDERGRNWSLTQILSLCAGPTLHSAEGVGFEPTRHFCPPVFKTGSIGRSDSPPGSRTNLSLIHISEPTRRTPI